MVEVAFMGPDQLSPEARDVSEPDQNVLSIGELRRIAFAETCTTVGQAEPEVEGSALYGNGLEPNQLYRKFQETNSECQSPSGNGSYGSQSALLNPEDIGVVLPPRLHPPSAAYLEE